MRIILQEQNFWRQGFVVPVGGALLFVAMALVGLKSFHSWSQVDDLYSKYSNPFDVIGSFHFYRFLASFPGLYLEQVLPSLGFSIFVAMFMFVAALFFQACYRKLYGSRPNLFIWLLFFCPYLMMNGRGALAWAAWMVCLYLVFMGRDLLYIVGWRVALAPVLLGVLLLASVSTGAFIVVLLGVGLVLARLLSEPIKMPTRVSMLSVILIPVVLILAFMGIVSAINYADAGVTKVLDYYGSLSMVIEHGAGALLSAIPLWAMLGLLAVAALALMLFVLAVGSRLDPVMWIVLVLVGACGLFGYTTLTLIIPVFLLSIPVMRINGLAVLPDLAPPLKLRFD